MLARVARYEVPSDRLDDAVEAFGSAAREIEGLPGFVSGYVLVDYEDGRTMTVTLWQTQDAFDSSESAARVARSNAANSVGGSVLSVERFDVAQELGTRAGSV
jgi:heme-degrading monooxygenase HmoA